MNLVDDHMMDKIKHCQLTFQSINLFFIQCLLSKLPLGALHNPVSDPTKKQHGKKKLALNRKKP